MLSKKIKMSKRSMMYNSYRKKCRPYYDKFLFMMIIGANLGEVASIGPLKLSWIFGISTIFVVFAFYNNDSRLFLINNKNKYTIIFVVFWLFYGLIQLLFVVGKPYSISFFIILVINSFLIFQIMLQTKNRGDVLYYNRALIISLAINIIIGLWEVSTHNHLVEIAADENMDYYLIRAHGVFGNVNDYCTFLYLGIVSLFICLFYEKHHKLLYIIMVCACIFLLLGVGSRGPIVGVIVFFLALPVCYFIIKHINKAVLTVSICLVILLVTIVFVQYPLEKIVREFSSSGNLESDLLRVDLIKGSLQLFLQSYLLGVGPGQSSYQLGINPHNFFIELLADYGIFIFIGFAILFVRLLFSFREIKEVKLAALNMAFVLSFSIVSVSSSSANRIRATWIVISILSSLVSFEEEVK